MRCFARIGANAAPRAIRTPRDHSRPHHPSPSEIGHCAADGRWLGAVRAEQAVMERVANERTSSLQRAIDHVGSSGNRGASGASAAGSNVVRLGAGELRLAATAEVAAGVRLEGASTSRPPTSVQTIVACHPSSAGLVYHFDVPHDAGLRARLVPPALRPRAYGSRQSPPPEVTRRRSAPASARPPSRRWPWRQPLRPLLRSRSARRPRGPPER
jgi:hypothetical protein